MDNVFIGTIFAIVAFMFFLWQWFVDKESAYRKYTLFLSFSFLIIGLAAFIGTVFDMPFMGVIGLLGLVFMVYFVVKIELAKHRARKDISDE